MTGFFGLGVNAIERNADRSNDGSVVRCPAQMANERTQEGIALTAQMVDERAQECVALVDAQLLGGALDHLELAIGE
jgi:hypothetical protein